MKDAAAPLVTYLNTSTQFMMADLYKFTLLDGTTITSSNWDRDLTVASVLYSCNGLKIKRAKTKLTVGLVVDQLDLTIYPASTDRIGALSFLGALNNGLLDGATFTLQRAFLSDATTVVGTLLLFSGAVSDTEFSRTEARLKIKSWLELLNVNLPRNLYQAGCRWTFGDSGCGVIKEPYAVSGTIAGGSTNQILNVSGLTQPTGYFDQGVIVFTSGILQGIKRTVRTFTSPTGGSLVDTVNLGLPLPHNPGYGDTFKIYPGCDKTMATCAGRFSNLLRFGGFPFIPVPETAR